MIDTLVGAGANDIGGINFMVSQASKLLDEAREQAVADARRKAEIYAKAAGVTLGEPLSISEEGAPAPMHFARMVGAMAASRRSRGRGDAGGDGERVLGDQAGQIFGCNRRHPEGVHPRVSSGAASLRDGATRLLSMRA